MISLHARRTAPPARDRAHLCRFPPARVRFVAPRRDALVASAVGLTGPQVGPRFDLRLYQIKLGTIDQEEVENEWVLRPYMNTASKRRAL